MISFQRPSLKERVKMLWPPYRKEVDNRTKEALRHLIEHPEEPCCINGHIVPHGYGNQGSLCKQILGFDI
jgi:hypothetical protein